MTNVVGKIGSAIRSILSKSDKNVGISKVEIPGYMDTIQDGLNSVTTAFSNGAVTTAFQTLLGRGKDADPAFKSIYDVYQRGLTSFWKSKELRAPFSAVAAMASKFSADVDDLRKNFDAVFGQSDEPTLSFDDLKVSTAFAFGCLAKMEQFVQWATFIIDYAGPQVRSKPPYRTQWLMTTTPSIVSFGMQSLRRGNGAITREVNDIKSTGNDTFVKVGGDTLDAYTHDNAFSPYELDMLDGFIRSPAMMVGSYLAAQRDAHYKSSLEMRDWINARMSIIMMQQRGVPENSPEFKRLAKIISNYEAERAKYDQAIARYEND